MNIIKQFFQKFSFFLLVFLALWLKTYLAYKLFFSFTIDNFIQEFILFINPISFLLLAFSLALFVPKKWRRVSILTVSTILTIILYSNVVYYRFFTDFITIPLLFQKENMGALGGSIFALLKWTDILFFVDLILFGILMKKTENKLQHIQKRSAGLLVLSSILIFYVNLMIAETQRPELLTRAFDREMLIKNIGTYNFHIYDIVIQTKTVAQKSLSNEKDFQDAKQYIDKKEIKGNPEYFGVAKNKNVIVISMESTQSFVINNRVNGQEVTPFLNKMIRDGELFYFDNLYHQTGQGKTSDAEFLVDNSLYPLGRGAVFFTHPQNTYTATPSILKEKGYYTSVLHANNKSFWNRDVVYKNFGYDKYYSLPYYQVNDENKVNWGLKDIQFFEQSIPHLEKMKQPFYARMLSLTNHFPFTLDEKDQYIKETNTNSQTVNRYFPTVRYTDEALKTFFEDLKKSGLYDNTVVIIYGDHYGISENHNGSMGTIMGRKITPFESNQLQRTPLFIHIPGKKGYVDHRVAGQIDIRPTLFNLLGVEPKDEIRLGNDLFAKNREEFTILRNGNFITKDYVYANNTCYSKDFGQEISSEFCQPFTERAKKELSTSESIIYGDLLRFVKKEGDAS